MITSSSKYFCTHPSTLNHIGVIEQIFVYNEEKSQVFTRILKELQSYTDSYRARGQNRNQVFIKILKNLKPLNNQNDMKTTYLPRFSKSLKSLNNQNEMCRTICISPS